MTEVWKQNMYMNKSSILILLYCLLGFTYCEACSCNSVGGVNENLEIADMVALGKVVSVMPISSDLSPVQYKFEISIGIKNAENGEVVILHSPSVPACGRTMEVGKKYLIYASFKNNAIHELHPRPKPKIPVVKTDNYWVGGCDRTQEIQL